MERHNEIKEDKTRKCRKNGENHREISGNNNSYKTNNNTYKLNYRNKYKRVHTKVNQTVKKDKNKN